jgi:hypothetical protein
MPEISVAPKTMRAIAQTERPTVAFNKAIMLPESSRHPLDVVNERVMATMEALRRSHQTVPAETINLMGQVLFGPIALSPEQYRKNEVEDEGLKLEGARVQHHLTHSFFYAGTDASSPQYSLKTQQLAEAFQKLSKGPLGDRMGLMRFWNGMRAELATVKVFSDAGYRVFLPDYTQNPLTTPQEQNETLQWDVRKGTDMIAVSDISTFLIDAKGRYLANGIEDRYMEEKENAEVFQTEVPKQQAQNLPSALGDFIGQFPNRHISRLKILIPTGDRYLSHLRADLATSPKDAMRNFAVIRPNIAQGIMRAIR